MKHQAHCYRTIGDIKMENYCDLIYSDEDNAAIVKECKALFQYVRKIKHPSGIRIKDTGRQISTSCRREEYV